METSKTRRIYTKEAQAAFPPWLRSVLWRPRQQALWLYSVIRGSRRPKYMERAYGKEWTQAKETRLHHTRLKY